MITITILCIESGIHLTHIVLVLTYLSKTLLGNIKKYLANSLDKLFAYSNYDKSTIGNSKVYVNL